MIDKEPLKLENNEDGINVSLTIDAFPESKLAMLTILQTEPFHRIAAIVLDRSEMKSLRDWLTRNLE